jgi:hypothetical protein
VEVNICGAAEWGFCNNGMFQYGVHKAFLASCGPISIRVGWYLAAGNKYNFVSSGICCVESPIFILKDTVPGLSSIARVRFLHITVYAIWRWPKLYYLCFLFIFIFTNCLEFRLSWAVNSCPVLNKFPEFYGTRLFVTVFTRARHWSLSQATWIRSTIYHPF